MMRLSVLALPLVLSTAAFAQQSSSNAGDTPPPGAKPEAGAKDKDKDEDAAKASAEESAQPVKRSISCRGR